MADPLKSNPLGVPAHINPMRSMPAQQFDRSIDAIKGPAPSGPGGSGASFTPPLWLTRDSDTEVRVAFGQVSGITPTNVNTPLDISSVDTTWSIYMHVGVGEDGVAFSAEVVAGSEGVPSDDSGNAYRLIGEADVLDGVITAVRPSMAWSQEFVCCTVGDPESYYWQVA